MFAEERHRLIGGLLADHGKVAVAELSERFGITRETVRRDLALLETSGVLRRVHGGAVAAGKASTTEESHTARTARNLAAKRAIALRALDLLPAGPVSAVFDAGTTTELLAEAMVERLSPTRAGEILAVTHALPIANRFAASPGFQLELVGGRVRGLTSAAIGARAVQQFEALRPDIAFLGTNGLHPGFGLSTPDALEAAVKSAIVRCARRVVVLADSSKFGEEALVRFAHLDDIDALVTDREPQGALAAELERAEVEVLAA
jgi:DeoR family transcriptional regulator, fructose operon transcriptional repressor